MSTVLIIGATSPTAQAFINLLESDYSEVDLKLFVRNPDKLTATQLQKYQVIVGDASKYDDYVTALKNVDYVYDSVGGMKTIGFSKMLIKAIVENHYPIKHVVDISAGGIYGEYKSGVRPYLSAVRYMYPQYTKDQLSKLDDYQASGLDFTIFRPGLIQNGPETQVITHTPDYRDIHADEFDINRTTFARAAANALFKGMYNRQSLSVSNGAAL
jgi:NmrA-like family.